MPVSYGIETVDVSYLNIELKLILDELLVCNMFL
jgi:hypothetical protein